MLVVPGVLDSYLAALGTRADRPPAAAGEPPAPKWRNW